VSIQPNPIRPIPTEIAEVYDKIRSEVTWLHGRWTCYRQLFAVSPKRIELLNESAGTFFYILQDVLFADIQVALCKLSDPAKQRGFENLSLVQLQARLQTYGDAELAYECGRTLDSLHMQCGPFRTWRHKKLAHLDLSTALRSSTQPLPAISRQMVEDALLTIRTYLNAIEMHYNNSEWCYEDFIMSSDGDALIATLCDGLRYEELVQERKLPFDDWRQGKWHDA
jgi:HEPN superfamily AbiU2-like protein